MRILLLAVFATLAACAPATYRVPPPAPAPGPSGQTYCEAVEAICDVDRLAGVTDADIVEADQKRFSYMEANVDNPQGVYLRTILSASTPAERATIMRDAQAEAGLTRCGYAESEAKRQD
ncbi:MAG: hypothetical protein HOV80_03910 [Polyangiaceae bacterium]|nr:hypothetical protein [Polyangiaceae bacterium]